MSNPIEQRMRDFAVGLLGHVGCLVEWPEHQPRGFAVLSPPAAAALESPPTTELSTAAEQNSLAINLGSSFLERAEGMLPPQTSVLPLRIDALYLKKSALDEPVARAFAFPNARVRVTGALPQRVEYDFWHFAAALKSDEHFETLLEVALNARTGAVLNLPDPLHNIDAHAAHLETAAVDIRPAVRAAAVKLEARAVEFIRRLEARLARDQQRLRSYYAALLDDADDRLHRTEIEAGQRAARRRAVQLELARKTEELRERYTLRPTLRPVALVRLEAPALAVTLQAHRRDSEGMISIYWNALSKSLEPLACGRCGETLYCVHFDDNFMPQCARCAAAQAPL